MRDWIFPTPRTDLPERLVEACQDDSLLAAILLNRGMSDPDKVRAFLDPQVYDPAPPEALPDLPEASALLRETIAAGRRVLVWGDFDVDGQTATSLLLDALRRLDADVCYYLPKRLTESHGIKLDSLKRQIEANTPDLLLTCDTGVTEHEAVAYARERGLSVIVTDHHDLDASLPAANAVINPKRLPVGHPLRSLPGVGVAYKLIQHLLTDLGRDRDLPRLLDLVALGIVGDVAMQTDDTRYLLQIGLDRLRRTERPGLLALIEVARLLPDMLDAEEIGYGIAPRLNAAGRLDDAALAVELLTTRDSSRAAVIAQQLEGLNNQRREMTSRIEGEAETILRADGALLETPVLVLHNPDWHVGLLGSVANRLAERYGRPAILLGGAEIAGGSARSFGGVDIHAAISAQADLLNTFGGHPGAAGLSLRAELVPEFRARIAAQLPPTRDPDPIRIDAVVTLRDLSPSLVYRLARIGPFGEGNPPIVLATPDLHLSHAGIVGRDNRHWRLVVEDDDGLMQQVMWWDGASKPVPQGRFDITYTLTVNDRSELEATLIGFREHAVPEVQAEEPTLNVKDWRREADPAKRLDKVLAADPEAVIWAEAYSRAERPTWKRRADLSPAETLIIYTAPSDPETLATVMRAVEPQTVHVFGVHPPLNTVEAFLKQLVIAVRNAIEHRGAALPMNVLCGATAASPAVIRAALDYLAAEGQFGWYEDEIGTLRFREPDGGTPRAEFTRQKLERLRRAYEEMDAYRGFFRIMPLRRQFG